MPNLTQHWQSNNRYYVINAHKDLLGDWVVVRTWGGLFNNRGNRKVSVTYSEADTVALVKQIANKRKHRGYSPTNTGVWLT